MHESNTCYPPLNTLKSVAADVWSDGSAELRRAFRWLLDARDA